MSEIKIESGIPAPTTKQGRKLKYPIQKLIVGESFFVEGKNTASMSTIMQRARFKSPERDFTSAKVEGGVRVWRIK